MNRLILTLLAAAALLGPLPTVSAALAKDRPGGHAQSNEGRHRDRGERDRGDSGSRRGEWRNEGRRGGEDRGDWRAPPRSAYGPPPGYAAPYAPPRSYGLRRGGYLPPQVHGGVVDDYGRYRLRPPPRGYDWVRVGDDFLLVSPDGQIFDMIRP